MKFKKKLFGQIGACLRIENCPSNLSDELIDLFTFNNPAYEQALKYSPHGYVSAKVPEFIHFARKNNEGTIFIPRGVNVSKLGDKGKKTFELVHWLDLRTRNKVEFPELQISLNKEQRSIIKNFNKAVKNSERPFGNFLYVKPTSTGKTITQAEIARLSGQRTLVICVTNLIRNTWLKDLETAYGLPPKKIGLIQQATWRIGEQFTLASIGTIRKRKHRWTELFEQFGTVILDEAHTVTQPQLFTFLMSHPAKYLIGATATDRKEGGTNFYLGSTFGTVVKRISAQHKETETSIPLSDVKVVSTLFQYEYQKQNLDNNDLVNHIISDEKRNRLIVNKAYDDWCEGHCVLVTTSRLAHVELLKTMLEEKGITDVNTLTGETNTHKKYTEKLITAIFKGDTRCLVATVKAIKLGGNLNPIDRLHLATPVVSKSDLEQLIGRIRRKWKDKKDCVLIYYLDSQVQYLFGVYKHKAVSVFRKLRVPKYKDVYIL